MTKKKKKEKMGSNKLSLPDRLSTSAWRGEFFLKADCLLGANQQT